MVPDRSEVNKWRRFLLGKGHLPCGPWISFPPIFLDCTAICEHTLRISVFCYSLRHIIWPFGENIWQCLKRMCHTVVGFSVPCKSISVNCVAYISCILPVFKNLVCLSCQILRQITVDFSLFFAVLSILALSS